MTAQKLMKKESRVGHGVKAREWGGGAMRPACSLLFISEVRGEGEERRSERSEREGKKRAVSDESGRRG